MLTSVCLSVGELRAMTCRRMCVGVHWAWYQRYWITVRLHGGVAHAR